MIIKSWTQLLKNCPLHVMPAGTRLHHGARRKPGEPLIQDVMWLTAHANIATSYVNRDPAAQDLVRELLTFEVIRDLRLLDCSNLSGPELSSMAQDEHGTAKVGEYDWPLRRHLLRNARAVHGDLIDGCMQCDDQVLLDYISEKLRQIP